MKLFLGIGSNLGDRTANIERAVLMLDSLLPGKRVALADLMENPSDGFDGPDFMNTVVEYEVVCESSQEELALEILRCCKSVEQSMGRFSKPVYGPSGERVYSSRVIDVDILTLGELKMDTPELVIPHPRMFEREFVTFPLASLADGKQILLNR